MIRVLEKRENPKILKIKVSEKEEKKEKEKFILKNKRVVFLNTYISRFPLYLKLVGFHLY